MDVAPKAGMWITQNLISHQGDYYIYHVKSVKGLKVFMDVTIVISKMTSGVWGESWRTGFNRPEGTIQFSSRVFVRQMFQVMKRPATDIRRAAIKVLFQKEANSG